MSKLSYPSPCIGICVLDEHKVCTGCGRALDEIAAWSRLTYGEQREVCVRALERRAGRAENRSAIEQ